MFAHQCILAFRISCVVFMHQNTTNNLCVALIACHIILPVLAINLMAFSTRLLFLLQVTVIEHTQVQLNKRHIIFLYCHRINYTFNARNSKTNFYFNFANSNTQSFDHNAFSNAILDLYELNIS